MLTEVGLDGTPVRSGRVGPLPAGWGYVDDPAVAWSRLQDLHLRAIGSDEAVRWASVRDLSRATAELEYAHALTLALGQVGTGGPDANAALLDPSSAYVTARGRSRSRSRQRRRQRFAAAVGVPSVHDDQRIIRQRTGAQPVSPGARQLVQRSMKSTAAAFTASGLLALRKC